MANVLLNYFRADHANPGDMRASPLNYFTFDIESHQLGLENDSSVTYRTDGHIVLGGGGLLAAPWFAASLRKLVRDHKGKLICWGAGHNQRFYPRRQLMSASATGVRSTARRLLKASGVLPIPATGAAIDYSTERDILDQFDLVGVRDYGTAHEWVPCASCMDPLLDIYRARPIEHDAVVFDHPDHAPIDFAGLPHLSNLGATFEQVLAFLASADLVITSSYHGAYWALLMNRRVVVVPWSTKFLGLKYPVPLAYEMLNARRHMKSAKRYPEALEECRATNRAFARRVADLINTDVRPTAAGTRTEPSVLAARAEVRSHG